MNNQYTFVARKPNAAYHKSDIGFLVAVLLLWGFGLFTIFVCSQDYAIRFFNNDAFYFVRRQIICSLAGFALFVFFLVLDMATLKRLVMYFVFISIIMCLLTFISPLSIEKNGARRWIRLPFNFTFQPSELIKFSLVLYLACFFDGQYELENEKERDVLPCVGVFLLMVILVLLQKDFSTSAFITVLGLTIFFVTGAKLRWFIPVSFLAIPIIVLLITSEQYRIDRIIGFLNPEQGASTFNFQVNASKSAISAGGFWGAGIGRGISKLNEIPEVHADYIFAGWSEVMGFFGVVFYFGLLVFFGWRGYKAAFNCPSRFAAYGSFGCVTAIVLQSIINCMVVCGKLPSTGIPLPFFTVGGSSIIVTLGMCGFILNASRCEEKPEKIDQFEEVNIDTLTIL